jgi:hypothetical protein
MAGARRGAAATASCSGAACSSPGAPSAQPPVPQPPSCTAGQSRPSVASRPLTPPPSERHSPPQPAAAAARRRPATGPPTSARLPAAPAPSLASDHPAQSPLPAHRACPHEARRFTQDLHVYDPLWPGGAACPAACPAACADARCAGSMYCLYRGVSMRYGMPGSRPADERMHDHLRVWSEGNAAWSRPARKGCGYSSMEPTVWALQAGHQITRERPHRKRRAYQLRKAGRRSRHGLPSSASMTCAGTTNRQRCHRVACVPAVELCSPSSRKRGCVPVFTAPHARSFNMPPGPTELTTAHL